MTYTEAQKEKMVHMGILGYPAEKCINILAAHQLDRRCFGMELEPAYCQIIVDRMIKQFPDLKITKNKNLWIMKK
jgi:hypothetical protein